MTTAYVARQIIPTLIEKALFEEVSWVVGKHHMDPDYDCGIYITCNSTGDWTDHPRYAGVNEEYREEGIETEKDFVIRNFIVDDNKQVKITLKIMVE